MKDNLKQILFPSDSFGSGVGAVPGPPALLPLQLLSQELHPVQALDNQTWRLGEHVLEGHSEQRQDLGVCEPEGGGRPFTNHNSVFTFK